MVWGVIIMNEKKLIEAWYCEKCGQLHVIFACDIRSEYCETCNYKMKKIKLIRVDDVEERERVAYCKGFDDGRTDELKMKKQEGDKDVSKSKGKA